MPDPEPIVLHADGPPGPGRAVSLAIPAWPALTEIGCDLLVHACLEGRATLDGDRFTLRLANAEATYRLRHHGPGAYRGTVLGEFVEGWGPGSPDSPEPDRV